jgi:hypothetical protein
VRRKNLTFATSVTITQLLAIFHFHASLDGGDEDDREYKCGEEACPECAF